MQDNTSQPSGGINRHAPRSDTRAWAGYVQRQSVYSSVSNPNISTVQPSNFTPIETKPSSESALQPKQNSQKVLNSNKVNYSGSFDMLVPSRAQPLQKPIQQNITNNQIAPAQTPVPIARPDPLLPTDLSGNVVAQQFENFGQQQISKHSSENLQTPKSLVPKIMVGMAVLLFLGGALVAGLGLRTNKEVKAQVKSASITQAKQDNDGGISEGMPDESGNPPSVEYYRTANTYPRVIRIAKTKTEARVLSLGIATTGALKAPGNIFDAGWYKDSAKPGEAGAMVVDGHVSGPTKPGIFKNLGKLVKDDTIEIERGDGKKFTYTVTAVKVFDADKLDMSSVMVSSVSGKPGLNIITCGGKFDKATNKYEQRTVVYAVIQ